MAKRTHTVDNAFQLLVTVYNNCDDVQLFWRTQSGDQLDVKIPASLGYRIERKRQTEPGKWAATEILRNRVGFSVGTAATDDSNDGFSSPSNICPFQLNEWTDHGAGNGAIVKYRISAMKLPAGGTAGTTEMEVVVSSDWTEKITVDANCTQNISAYFNRGFVMSQFVSRYARLNSWPVTAIKSHIKEIQEPLRRFLSGEIRKEMLSILDEVMQNPSLAVYAALYELDDDELIGELKLLGKRAHIVLSNGSDKQGDENSTSREELKKAKVDVKDRLLRSKGLGHNKFLLIYDEQNKKAVKVHTGSTNWTSTGLCTQFNNAILINNGAVAELYYQQWNLLANSGSDFPPALVQSNAASPKTDGNIDVWFTRVRNSSSHETDMGSDLNTLVQTVQSAKESVFYVMFEPGPQPLEAILGLPDDIVVRGVVSTMASTTKEKFTIDGVMTSTAKYHTELLIPDGISESFSYWVKEIQRNEFLSKIGYAITHCKMIVVDPMSADCKVITGSHNFSKSSSEKNDENFLIIRGNQKLAQAYAVACMNAYSHYSFAYYVNQQLAEGKQPWEKLSDDPGWQTSYLTANRKKLLAAWFK